MKTPLYYPKAPIVEAVLDLHVVPSEEFSEILFDQVESELRKEFTVKNIDEMQFAFHVGKNQQNNFQTRKRVGIKLESANARYVIQARENGYAFSILNYYDQWESFSKEAYKYWNIYKRIFKPQKIIRQALRYINRIDIPETKFKMEKYFKIYPYLFDKDMDIDCAGFFMQVQIPQQKEGGVANITQTVAQAVTPGCTSILLDIDIFDNQHFKPNAKRLKERIEMLRNQKNSIFKSAITQETEELIS